MLYEASPQVQEYFLGRTRREQDEKAKGRRLSIKYWLEQIGVVSSLRYKQSDYDDNALGLHYAWPRPGGIAQDGAVLTIWTESILCDGDVWYAWDCIDADKTALGKPRDPDQAGRIRERAAILRALYAVPRAFDALLLENELTEAEMAARPKASAKINASVRDEQLWRVAQWDQAGHRVLLVRGAVEHGLWSPPEQRRPGLAFPDQAHRDAVERAAVEAVTAHYQRTHMIKSRENDCVGYDLELVSRATGELEFCVEVKGTAGKDEHFYITVNEWNCAKHETRWRLIIVTEALAKDQGGFPVVGAPMDLDAVDAAFSMEPIAWHATR